MNGLVIHGLSTISAILISKILWSICSMRVIRHSFSSDEKSRDLLALSIHSHVVNYLKCAPSKPVGKLDLKYRPSYLFRT
jgi:hypothetical protein